jgi:CSLREA domain-containing protein
MKRIIRTDLVAIGIALVAMSTAHTAEIVVTNGTDVAGAGTCSLREAINAANNDSTTNGCQAGSGADTIRFQIPAPGRITLASGLPPILTAITINGSGQDVEINGGGRAGVLEVSSAGILDLREVTIANGEASNRFDRGGGIYNLGQTTVTECTFRDNRSLYEGGAIYNRGLLTVTRSAFLANSVSGGGGAISNGLPGRATVANSTFFGNESDDQPGTAIANHSILSLLNCTITGNRPRGELRSGVSNGGDLTMANTIVARNGSGLAFLDCTSSSPITATGPNLIGDRSCAVAGALDGDPKLASLADNGGPTMTFALLAGSIAIDAGNDTICAANPMSNEDQRGAIRPFGSHCDLGAFELTPTFVFTGFQPPVRNLPTVNTVKAGQAVPVKFSLAGNQELNIFAPGYPKSQPMACVSGAPLDDVTATVSAGGSSLSYDSGSDTYSYVWKTDKSWKGCRQLILKLVDSTVHTATFEFR